MTDEIGHFYNIRGGRVYVCDYEPTAKKFAKYFNGTYKLNGMGLFEITI